MERYCNWKRNPQVYLKEMVLYMIMFHKPPDYIVALIISVAGISLVVLSLAPLQITIAQQTHLNQTFSDLKQHPFLQDISFDINNVTFSHHMASVNGIQLHYVIGGQENQLCYCTAGHKPGMNGDMLCQPWLKTILSSYRT